MSDQNDPTQSYRAYDDDSTRLERPIAPYADERPEVSGSLYTGEGVGAHAAGSPPSNPGIVAQLVTVALISILVGIGIGYLLFHDTGSSKPNTATTTTTAIVAPSTSSSTTSTTEPESTSTTRKSSTSTTSSRSSTSTTSSKSTSTTEGGTSTTAKKTTSTTG